MKCFFTQFCLLHLIETAKVNINAPIQIERSAKLVTYCFLT